MPPTSVMDWVLSGQACALCCCMLCLNTMRPNHTSETPVAQAESGCCNAATFMSLAEGDISLPKHGMESLLLTNVRAL